MSVKLKQVIDHVVAMEGPEVDPHRIAIVRETIAAVGLLVNAANDEVYRPYTDPPPSWASQQTQRNARSRFNRRR